MSNDDDRLDDFDLSAWEAPPPPADLADVVVGRMGGTDVGIAMPSVEPAREPRRTWLIVGVAVAVVVVALGTWSIVRGTRQAAPATGGVIADRSRTLSLDTVHATLDAGADIRWQRKGDTLYVEQRAGNASWRVDAGEKLVITAGASSAAVEASGANLRVEVQMNATDVRVIGASALTAAAVAMVTVIVYEGHVKVGRSGQQTVVVAPGSTYKLEADKEPPVIGATAPKDAIAAGKRVAILGLEVMDSANPEARVIAESLSATMRRIAKDWGPYQLAPNSDRELVDEKLMNNCGDEATDCMAAIGGQLGVDVLIYGRLETRRGEYEISVKLFDVPRKTVGKSGIWLVPSKEATGDSGAAWSARIYKQIVSVAVTTCDAKALKDQAMEQINLGQHAAALAKLEQSLACKLDPYVVQLAFMESCASRNAPKAKQYYKQMTPAQQANFAQICIRNKTAYSDDSKQRVPPAVPAPPADCDAAALKDEGMAHINAGQHAAALAKLEASLTCKRDPYVVQLAFMESCSSRNSAKAKLYYKQMVPAQQQKFAQLCIRMKVEYEDAGAPGTTDPRSR